MNLRKLMLIELVVPDIRNIYIYIYVYV